MHIFWTCMYVYIAVFVMHIYMCFDSFIPFFPAARNPFTDQRYLIAAVPKGVLLMQWYQPKHAFMHVMVRTH